MNELFQYVTTLNEEIIDNDLHHPYKRIIFECNYCHRKVIYSDTFVTMGLCQHVINLFNFPLR